MSVSGRRLSLVAALGLLLVACSDPSSPDADQPASSDDRAAEMPRIELVSASDAAGRSLQVDEVPRTPYHLVGNQIQRDVRNATLPGTLTYRIDRVPADADLSFGVAVTPLIDPGAEVDFEVVVEPAGAPPAIALRATLSNWLHRPLVEVAGVRTEPAAAGTSLLVDRQVGVPWVSPTAGRTMVQLDLAEAAEVTAFSIGSDGFGDSSPGIPVRIRVAVSPDGMEFGEPKVLDHVPRPKHQWHLLSGESIAAIRVWVEQTHDGEAARIDEIALTTERDLGRLGNQLERWTRSSLDLSKYEGESIRVTFRFGGLVAQRNGGDAMGWLSGPRIDLPLAADELNVVLISVDTVRADRMSVYGYQRPTTPFLEELAGARGTAVFDNARSTSTWTQPSHLAMMVGRTPFQLHVNPSQLRMTSWRKHEGGVVPLSPSVPTLASILREHGYKTEALSSAGGTDGQLGLRNGFDVYDQGWNILPSRPLDYFGELVSKTRRVDDWLSANRSRRFLLFLHTYVAHAPYLRLDYAGCDQSERAARRCRRYLSRLHRADNRLRRGSEWGAQGSMLHEAAPTAAISGAMYDGGLKLMDDFVRSVFDSLDRLHLRDTTLVVITSDHGEPFGEHHADLFQGEHGYGLYDEYLRIPLLLAVPGLDGPVRSDLPASLVDIAPTILDLVGVETDVPFEGKSLLPAVRGRTEGMDLRPIFYEVLAREDREDHHFIAASKGNFKILANTYDLYDGRHELYDLAADPGERSDLAEQEQEISADLLREIDRHLARAFGGLIVLDVSTLGLPSEGTLEGRITFDRPVELFDIAVRRPGEFVRLANGKRNEYEFRLVIGEERRLLGFGPSSDEMWARLETKALPYCKLIAGGPGSVADGRTVVVRADDLETAALPLQADLRRQGACTIRLQRVEPNDKVVATDDAPSGGEIGEADRERILEQMRALGYLE